MKPVYIVSDNIDKAGLEKQRKQLHRLLGRLTTPHSACPPQAEIDALEAVINVLDAWADKRYYRRHKRRCIDVPHEFVISAAPVCEAKLMEKIIRIRLGGEDQCGFDYKLEKAH